MFDVLTGNKINAALFFFGVKCVIIQARCDMKKNVVFYDIFALFSSSLQKDASQYFMVNSSTGYLYQIKHFDYENTTIQCVLAKGGGNINISAEVRLYVICWYFSYEKGSS